MVIWTLVFLFLYLTAMEIISKYRIFRPREEDEVAVLQMRGFVMLGKG